MDTNRLAAFNPIEQDITLFLLINVMLALLCSFILLACYLRARYLWVKPSFWLISYLHILLQWPLAIYAGYYEERWPDPWMLTALLNVSVLGGLCFSVLLFNAAARAVWFEISKPGIPHVHSRSQLMFLLVVLSVTFFAYLAYVPFKDTGLYAMIFEPERTALAREESLKLLDSAFVKYAYFIGFSVISPLIAALATYMLLRQRNINSLPVKVFLLTSIVLACGFNLLSGARIGIANILVVIALTTFWCRGLRFSPSWIGASIMAVLLPAIVVTFLRESGGAQGDFEKIVELTQAVAFRAFGTPIEVGAWYVHYTDTYGAVGIAGIQKMASAVGVPSIDLANHIAQLYVPVYTDDIVMETTSATAGFIFSSYAVAGAISLLFIPLMIVALDVIVPLIKRLDVTLQISTLSALSWTVVMFIQSDYLTVFITHGFAVLPLFSLLLKSIFDKRS